MFRTHRAARVQPGMKPHIFLAPAFRAAEGAALLRLLFVPQGEKSGAPNRAALKTAALHSNLRQNLKPEAKTRAAGAKAPELLSGRE
jgi:hypothetical protein